MITERVMPIAMFLFFLMIGINGFIVVAGGLEDANGSKISNIIGGNIAPLSSDLNSTTGSIVYNPSGTDQATTSTSAGFNIWDVTTYWNGIADTATNVIGVKNVGLINNALFGIEQYMNKYSALFPDFAAIFGAVVFFTLSIKLLVFTYAGSILVRLITGRGIY